MMHKTLNLIKMSSVYIKDSRAIVLNIIRNGKFVKKLSKKYEMVFTPKEMFSI